MAWRPTAYLIEGELDNTTPGKVTGWMRFAGMTNKVTFDLDGNFHRDIRGAKIRFTGDGLKDDPEAASYMDGFGEHQTGKVGDITTGLPPSDYLVGRPYAEWYDHENGRVVLELEAGQVEVIGQPIPACESDPISREEQARNMANFLAGLSREAGVPAIAPGQQLMSDPQFSHWVVVQGYGSSARPGRSSPRPTGSASRTCDCSVLQSPRSTAASNKSTCSSKPLDSKRTVSL